MQIEPNSGLKAGQNVVGDVTRAGYNLVNGRGVTDTSSIASTSCASLSCQTWTSPQQATEWATRVLGEQVQRTCDSCTKTETVPGASTTGASLRRWTARVAHVSETLGSKTRTWGGRSGSRSGRAQVELRIS